MCIRDTESVNVEPESVLNNRVESRRYALDRGGFAPGEVFAWGVSPGQGCLRGSYLRTPSDYMAIKLDDLTSP